MLRIGNKLHSAITNLLRISPECLYECSFLNLIPFFDSLIIVSWDWRRLLLLTNYNNFIVQCICSNYLIAFNCLLNKNIYLHHICKQNYTHQFQFIEQDFLAKRHFIWITNSFHAEYSDILDLKTNTIVRCLSDVLQPIQISIISMWSKLS